MITLKTCEYLKTAVVKRKNILVVGGTDSKKTSAVRLAWLEAKMHDLEVLGYNPTSQDLSNLKRLQYDIEL